MKRKKISYLITGAFIVSTLSFLAIKTFVPNFFNKVLRNDFSQNAYDAVNKGDFGEAERILKENIQKDAGNCITQLYLANVYLEEGYVGKNTVADVSAARKILSKLQKENKCQIERADVLMGYSYELEGNMEKAEEYYDDALKKNSDDPDALFHKGRISWFLGDAKEAEDFYLKAESNLSQKTPEGLKGKIFVALGKLYGSNGDNVAKVEGYFQKALKETKNKNLKAEIYYNLSSLDFYQKVNFKEAVENGLKAIEIDPSNDLGYLACARVKVTELSFLKDKTQIKKEDLDKINQYLQMATNLNSERAMTQYWFGQFVFALGDTSEALKRYEIALTKTEKDDSLGIAEKDFLKSEIFLAEGIVYMSLDDQENAKKSLMKAYAFNPVKTSFMIEAMK